MNRYRVYIKKARSNILGNLPLHYQPGYESIAYANSDYIPVDNLYSYELKKIQGSQVKIYDIYEYDSEKTQIASSPLDNTVLDGDHIHVDESVGHRNNKPYKYIPANASIKYIKIYIWDSDIFVKGIVDSYMFLRSESAILIHDSGAIDEKYHLLNATLTLTDNSAGSFEFGVYKKHIYYKTKMNLWTDTIYITRTYSDGSERICWDGRIISEDYDSSGNRSYHAEGALNYLADMRVQENIKDTDDDLDPSELTVAEFIDGYILGDINWRNDACNRMDRALYYSKNIDHMVTNVPDFYNCNEGSTIHIDTGSTFEWRTTFESGLKWIDDIKEAFRAHFKIRYRYYDSPSDDTICRVLTGVKDFEKTYELKKIEFGKDLKLNRDEIRYYKMGNDVKVYKVATDTYVDLLPGNTNDEKIQYAVNYYRLSELPTGAGTLYTIENDKAFANTLYNRLPKIYARFGKDIFSGKITKNITNFATRILPKGAEWEDLNGIKRYVYLNYDYITGSDGKKRGNWTSNKSAWIEDVSLIKQYGLNTAIVTFEDCQSSSQLETEAIKWFNDLKKEIISKNIEMSLTSLFSSIVPAESDPVADNEYLDVWTQVIAEIPELGITSEDPEKYYISSVSIPIDNYINTQVTLSSLSTKISDNSISSGDITGYSKGIIDSSSSS